MIKRTLLAAVLAASALASTPAIARPMTATDMHMLRRLGAPSVSPDGRFALFTLSSTDLAANRRNNPLHLLDLRRPGAVPQPVQSTGITTSDGCSCMPVLTASWAMWADNDGSASGVSRAQRWHRNTAFQACGGPLAMQ